MTSNHHAPYDLGYTRATMALHEAGIASNRESECRGEYVPGSCTHRPSHHGSRECPKLVT